MFLTMWLAASPPSQFVDTIKRIVSRDTITHAYCFVDDDHTGKDVVVLVCADFGGYFVVNDCGVLNVLEMA